MIRDDETAEREEASDFTPQEADACDIFKRIGSLFCPNSA